MATEEKGIETAKTPGYAWPCLFVSLFVAVTVVWAWQWLPGLTFEVFIGWLAQNNPAGIPAVANVMGFIPIGALIMAFPATFLVRKIGPKWASVVGVALGIVGTALCALFAESSFAVFLAGRIVMGLSLACTIIAGPTCVSIWFPDSTRGRAMAIWSCWAPVGILSVMMFGTTVYELVGASIPNLMWVWVVCMIVSMFLFIAVFREPSANEASEVSSERLKVRDVLWVFKNRSFWCLVLVFAIFNYMNYGFTQYLKPWMLTPIAEGGLGWSDPVLAGLVSGLLCASGILAPIGGLILDKLAPERKFLAVVAGIVSLTLCCALSFRTGTAVFALYAVFFCVGNMMLNGCCRPMIPGFVFKGGATAVAFGLSFLTCGEYIGMIPTSYVFAAGIASGLSYSTIMMYFFVTVGVLGIVISLFVRAKKPAKPKESDPRVRGAEGFAG